MIVDDADDVTLPIVGEGLKVPKKKKKLPSSPFRTHGMKYLFLAYRYLRFQLCTAYIRMAVMFGMEPVRIHS